MTSSDLIQAKRLILQEEYEEAKKLLFKLGKTECADAQLILGYLYYTGDEDTTREQAKYWLSRSSKNGNPEAMYYLASTDFQEEMTTNFPQNESCLSQLTAAAELGSAEAQRSLAVAYAHGEIVDHCDETTMYWDEKAASQGLAESQNDLALMLLNGFIDGPPKIDEAIYWYEQSAKYDANVPYAQWASEQLARIYGGAYGDRFMDEKKENFYSERAKYLNGLDFRAHPDWFYRDFGERES